jgi:hypothetical protein
MIGEGGPRHHRGKEHMPLAVRFDAYGDIDVLKVVEVARPVPGPGKSW